METKKVIIILLSIVLLSIFSGCDLDRHDKCEWYLVPEPNDIQYVGNGWVSVCARNYVTQKQRCFLRMKIEKAEKVYGKPVTFSSLKLGKGVIKEVKSYKLCRSSGEDRSLKRRR